MKTFLFTPTGFRPKHFALCEKWVARFKEKFEWVVVDDSPNPVTCTMGQTLIHRTDKVRGPTLGANTKAMIAYAGRTAQIVIIEDDVWYAPDHLTKMLELLETNELVGTEPAFVYNVKQKSYRVLPAPSHASYSETAVRCMATEQLYRLSRQFGTNLDVSVWKTFRGDKKLETLSHALAVSMKGHGQARPLGSFHVFAKKHTPDPDLTKLREWIGADVDEYYKDGEMI